MTRKLLQAKRGRQYLAFRPVPLPPLVHHPHHCLAARPRLTSQPAKQRQSIKQHVDITNSLLYDETLLLLLPSLPLPARPCLQDPQWLAGDTTTPLFRVQEAVQYYIEQAGLLGLCGVQEVTIATCSTCSPCSIKHLYIRKCVGGSCSLELLIVAAAGIWNEWSSKGLQGNAHGHHNADRASNDANQAASKSVT